MNPNTAFQPGDIVRLTAPCTVEIDGDCECCGRPKSFDIELAEGRIFEVAHDDGSRYVSVHFVSNQYRRQRILLDAWFVEMVRRPENFPRCYSVDLFTFAGVTV
ncbi:hypothetical protein G4Y79_15215 [Phototrophicus methaneseepsis]|uniref:Uncharacterized protein n=1 Tax=Phototrophicus methaneseepsis TaxID=2710758 RepID=A0A7S8E635_9CHLR|nr:hypothetical protein [Phototrophicus methaneseepsis]QPC81052.1 hypothetical protein G4Y79_15215 [Phototrophicus methaneseepsis]